MTGMEGKKDPGKFTVRFNLHDPLQRRAAELLNQQGRSKAQFIANAILSYADGQVPIPQGVPEMDSGQLRHLVEDILTQWQDQRYEGTFDPPAGKNEFNSAERLAIAQTLDTFKQQ